MKKIINLALVCLFVYGIYFVFDRTQIIQKTQCTLIGKDPVSSNDLGKITDNPWIVCAEPTVDGGEDCYDSNDCKGACILDPHSEGYTHAGDFISQKGSTVGGYCQPYEETSCFVERNRGIIVVNKCP